jgi:hypothetical protein
MYPLSNEDFPFGVSTQGLTNGRLSLLPCLSQVKTVVAGYSVLVLVARVQHSHTASVQILERYIPLRTGHPRAARVRKRARSAASTSLLTSLHSMADDVICQTLSLHLPK